MPDPTQPGWHQDPYGSDELRWFDGHNWAGTESDYARMAAASPRSKARASQITNVGRGTATAVAAVLVLCAVGAYWLIAQRSSQVPLMSTTSSLPSTSSSPPTSSPPVMATGSFCHDFQKAAGSTSLDTHLDIPASASRALALEKLTAFQRTVQVWGTLWARLLNEAPAGGVHNGVQATSFTMSPLVGPVQTAITAVGSLPPSASPASVAGAVAPLKGSIFFAQPSQGSADIQTLANFPSALDADCGAGYAAKLGVTG